MNADELVVLIERAFADVHRDDGITLHEAYVIDAQGSDAERKEARLEDLDHNWQDVSDKVIEEHLEALPFLDPKGFHYYMPAYMRWTVRHCKESDAYMRDAAVYALKPTGMSGLREYENERWATFNEQQRQAIIEFLSFMAKARDESAGDCEPTAQDAIDYHWSKFSQKSSAQVLPDSRTAHSDGEQR